MTTNNPEELKKMLKVLKDAGVSKCSFDSSYNMHHIEFFARDDVEKLLDPEEFQEANYLEKTCLCGHLEETEHSSAGCLNGCPIENCIAKKEVVS